jgi:branched-chain amino acid transport system substrate-binding protein
MWSRAFFQMVNENGGINGRKINFISLDDAYSPPKSVEQVRKPVEQDEVALMFNSFGGPTNAAQAKYLNRLGVPQPFVATCADYWGDIKMYPWSMGWQPSFRTEAQIYAKAAIARTRMRSLQSSFKTTTSAKDYLLGLTHVIDKQSSVKIVSEISYLTTEPTVDSQLLNLRAS